MRIISSKILAPAMRTAMLLAGIVPPFFGFAGGATAERPASPAPLILVKIDDPIRLDGVIDEAAWQGIAPLPFVGHTPEFGRTPSEKTDVLLAYDDEFLYVAGRLFDREPERIQANSKQRDSMDASSDWFGVVLDTFNDKENALAFFTTPAGLRWDAAVSHDARGEMPLNFDWNSFWDVAVTRNELGWFVEMRIPLSSLRFQTNDGEAAMGIISWRSIARKNEWMIFPSIPPDWGFWSLFKPSLARECLLKGVKRRSPLYLTPHVLWGAGRENGIRRNMREAGFDVKYGLTSNITLDGTVYPDFAQVEADDAQVNLTRFSLFYPEKRPFFQERASIFEFSFEPDMNNRLFHSRRIGLEDGEIVPIYGGGRLTGRIGDWDIGFLDMQAAGRQDRPSENFGVLRLRRQILNLYSYAGGILTARLSEGGRFNIVGGLDTQIRLFGDDYLVLKWARSFEEESKDRPFAPASSRVYASWTRQTGKGPSYQFAFSRSGADFDPGLGFETRTDFSLFKANLGYGWMPGPKSMLLAHQVRAEAAAYLRNSDGRADSAWTGVLWKFETKSGFSGLISPYALLEDLRESFDLSGNARIPAGRYRFGGFAVLLQSPAVRALSLAVKAEAGGFYDGRRVSFSIIPTWNASPSLRIEASHSFDRAAFPVRNQIYAAHIVRLRALVMLSVELSATAFLQYESDGGRVTGNFRVRYNPREGVDFYLVYNEARTSGISPAAAEPNGLVLRGRALLFKVAYTL